MTSANMGRRYVEEALGRTELVGLAQARGRWSTVVREAQEAVELLLKGALRLIAVEPARTHDVADLMRREAQRFPEWMRDEVDHLASISTEMAGDRGLAYYGDERQARSTGFVRRAGRLARRQQSGIRRRLGLAAAGRARRDGIAAISG
jgi:HEPN domain-containing protein